MPSIALIGLLSMLILGDPPVSWSFVSTPLEDGTTALEMTAHVEAGWHIYATQLENDLGPIPTTITIHPSEGVESTGALVEPEPEEVYDQNFQMNVRYHSGEPLFVQRVKVTSSNPVVVEGEVEYMVCNDKTCLPPTTAPFRLEVKPSASK